MKIEWLVTNVTAIGSSGRAEDAILGVVVAGRFWPIQVIFVVAAPLCGVGSPSRSLITLLRVI